MINSAIGGQTSWQGLERIERDVYAHKPAICFVGFGGNDLVWAKSGKEPKYLAKFRKSMTEIVRGCKKRGIKPVLLNGSRQYWVDDKIYTREVCNAIERIGRATKIPVIDSHSFTWTGPKEDWLCYDNLHLNNLGQMKFAKEIIRFLLNR